MQLSGNAILSRQRNAPSSDEFDFVTEAQTEFGTAATVSFEGSLVPRHEIRVAINNSRNWTDRSARTGSLAKVRREYKSIVHDGQWFKLRIEHRGQQTSVWVNDVLLVRGFCTGRRLTIRTGMGQAKVCFKHADPAVAEDIPRCIAWWAGTPDEVPAGSRNSPGMELPLINYHIHLKGGLTLEKALEHSRETGFSTASQPTAD